MVSRINLGGEKDILPALLGKLAKTLLAQPLQRPARVGTRGVEVIDAQIKGSLEQRLRGIFVLNGTESAAEPEPDEETISPVLPRRRFGRAGCRSTCTKRFSAAPKTIAAVVVFKNSRRDQRDFMLTPFLSSGEHNDGVFPIPRQATYHKHQTGETSL